MVALGMTPYNQELYIKCNISSSSVSHVLYTDNVVVLWIGSAHRDKNSTEHQLHFSKWKMSVKYLWNIQNKCLGNSRRECAPRVSFTGRYRLYLLAHSHTEQNSRFFNQRCFVSCGFIFILLTPAFVCRSVSHDSFLVFLLRVLWSRCRDGHTHRK